MRALEPAARRPALGGCSTWPAAPATSPSASRTPAAPGMPRSPSPTSTATMLAVGRERAETRGLAAASTSARPMPRRCPSRMRASTPTRSPSASATCRASRRRSPKRYRVLKHGGRFLCLEFSEVDVPMLDRIYEAYSFNVIPALGRVVTGDAESYRYLVESIRTFPNQERFADMIARRRLRARRLPQFFRRHRRAAFRLEALSRARTDLLCGLRAPASCWPAPAPSAASIRRSAAAGARGRSASRALLEPRGLAPTERGRACRTALNRLGPSYIKLGQFLATRPDIVGTEMARRARRAEGRPAAVPDRRGARAIVEASIGRPVERVFDELLRLRSPPPRSRRSTRR